MDKKTIIVSAFPGCGKTYLVEHQDEFGITCVDSDSSKFDKVDNWESAYVDRIESYMGTVDFVFISMHPPVLQELRKRNITFYIVSPDNTYGDDEQNLLIKQQWFGRFALRDNSHIKDLDTWMKKLSKNYDIWTSWDSLMKHGADSIFLLSQDQYLSSIIDLIQECDAGDTTSCIDVKVEYLRDPNIERVKKYCGVPGNRMIPPFGNIQE